MPPCSLLLASGLEKTTFESAVQSPFTSWSATFLAVFTAPWRSPAWDVMTSDPPERRHLARSSRTHRHWEPRSAESNSSLPVTAVLKSTVYADEAPPLVTVTVACPVTPAACSTTTV